MTRFIKPNETLRLFLKISHILQKKPFSVIYILGKEEYKLESVQKKNEKLDGKIILILSSISKVSHFFAIINCIELIPQSTLFQ